MAIKNLASVMAKIDVICQGYGDKEAQVGFFPQQKSYEDGATVALVATVQEFGAPEIGIPPRPFMRPTVQDKQKQWADEMAAYIKLSLTGKVDPEGVFAFIGNAAAEDIGKTIDAGDFKELSPITLMLRKMKDEHKGDSGWHVTGAIVGEAARRVAAGEQGSDRTTPLHDSGLLRASLQYLVVDKS